ncbi:MAG: hypothetical protein AB7N24_20380 [Dehalococcoidia bacterium]
MSNEDVRHHRDLFALTNDLSTEETTLFLDQIHLTRSTLMDVDSLDFVTIP